MATGCGNFERFLDGHPTLKPFYIEARCFSTDVVSVMFNVAAAEQVKCGHCSDQEWKRAVREAALSLRKFVIETVDTILLECKD